MSALHSRFSSAKRQQLSFSQICFFNFLCVLVRITHCLSAQSSFTIMTSSLLSWPPLPIPITTQSRQRSHPENGEAYLYRCNLATAAIASYLQMIAVPHRIETSSSGTQLYVEELGGYVACCPVFPNEQKCEVLDHERANCKGFLFVELSDPYYQAYVLGFVREVSVRELPLSYLQPLSAFYRSPRRSRTSQPVVSPTDLNSSVDRRSYFRLAQPSRAIFYRSITLSIVSKPGFL